MSQGNLKSISFIQVFQKFSIFIAIIIIHFAYIEYVQGLENNGDAISISKSRYKSLKPSISDSTIMFQLDDNNNQEEKYPNISNGIKAKPLSQGVTYPEDGMETDEDSIATANNNATHETRNILGERLELDEIHHDTIFASNHVFVHDANENVGHRKDSQFNLMESVMKNNSVKCRTEWGIEFPFDIYTLDTCARCYHYMPETAFKYRAKFSYIKLGLLMHQEFNLTLYSNETTKLINTFNSISMVLKWQQCCTDAVLCCINYHKRYQNQQGSEDHNFSASNVQQPKMQCPPTWDGWLCWNDYAKPGEILKKPCPKHIYWHQRVPPCRGYVTKLCDHQGHWYVNQDNREWSNYTMCARDDIYARRIRYSLVTNIISILALIPALFIFIHYKQVSSISRIRLHKHLFTSLLFHAKISALLKWHLLNVGDKTAEGGSSTEDEDLFVVPQPSILSSSSSSTSASSHTFWDKLPPFCLVLSLLQRYFRSTNYLWMFNEALYLHQLIKQAFTQPSLRPLIILAYILPFLTTTSYVIARSFFNQIINMTTTSTSTSIGSNDNTNNQHSSMANLFELSNQSIIANFFSNQNQKKIEDGSVEFQLFLSDYNYDDEDEENTNEDHHHNYDQIKENDAYYDVASKFNILDPFEENSQSMLMDYDQCWLMPSHQPWHEWIINGPNLAILIINCFFLMWLLRVLCIKAAASATSPSSASVSSRSGGRVRTSTYRATIGAENSSTRICRHSLTRLSNSNAENTNGISPSSHSEASSPPIQGPFGHGRHRPSMFNRQTFLVSLRAAVLLLPLYGLHYLFIVYRPKIENCWLSETYHYLSLSFDGLQGLAVSIIFCFANSEIRNLLNRSFQRVSNRQRSLTIYMSDVGPIGNRE